MLSHFKLGTFNIPVPLRLNYMYDVGRNRTCGIPLPVTSTLARDIGLGTLPMRWTTGPCSDGYPLIWQDHR